MTGAGTGVGRAVAIALAKAGYSIVLAGRRKEMLDKVVGEINAVGAQALGVPTDVSKREQILALFATVKASFGRLDLLFNNAGIGAPPVPLEDLPFETWQNVVATNFTGMFLCTQEAIKIMKSQTPARRPHHQQRLDLGARAAAVLGRLYLDQARGHRPDQIHLARLPAIRHLLRADRHRQRGDAAHRAHGAGRRHAAGRPARKKIEPRMDAEHVGNAVVYMAGLPLNTNVLFMTVMANTMPFVGRGLNYRFIFFLAFFP